LDGLDVDLEHAPDFFASLDGQDVDLEHEQYFTASCGQPGRVDLEHTPDFFSALDGLSSIYRANLYHSKPLKQLLSYFLGFFFYTIASH
jgi:hypothetical protein